MGDTASLVASLPKKLSAETRPSAESWLIAALSEVLFEVLFFFLCHQGTPTPRNTNTHQSIDPYRYQNLPRCSCPLSPPSPPSPPLLPLPRRPSRHGHCQHLCRGRRCPRCPHRPCRPSHPSHPRPSRCCPRRPCPCHLCYCPRPPPPPYYPCEL
jgi:hypothetical protein